MSSTRVTAVIGVEIAHWLFSHTKTTAASSTAARLNASWRMPWFAAPSPKKQTVTPSFPWRRRPCAAPTAIAGRAGDDRVCPEHSLVDRRDVHAATVAAAIAVLATEDLGHHPGEVEALGDAVPMTAVGARDRDRPSRGSSTPRPRSPPCRRTSAPARGSGARRTAHPRAPRRSGSATSAAAAAPGSRGASCVVHVRGLSHPVASPLSGRQRSFPSPRRPGYRRLQARDLLQDARHRRDDLLGGLVRLHFEQAPRRAATASPRA